MGSRAAGVLLAGGTREEAVTNIADAIREYVDARMDKVGAAEVREIEVVV